MRVVRAPQLMRVNDATFIPSGMHGAVGGVPEKPEQREAAELVFKNLVGRGIHPNVARGLVVRAKMRHHGRIAHQRRRAPGFKYMRSAGLSDDDTVGPPLPDDQLLATVQAKANDVQTSHKALIGRIPSAASDADRLAIRNSIDGLYQDWTQYAVGVKDGAAPYQWDRTNPVDAILIAVRDDLRDTVNLFDANKAQAALQKNIALLSKFGQPGKGGPLFNVDVPWYVWGGAAAAAVGIAGKTLHLW
jgi:hypothetical protein